MVHKKGLEFGKESLRVALDEMEDMEKLINECRSDVPIFSAAIGRHLEAAFYEHAIDEDTYQKHKMDLDMLTGEFRDRCSCTSPKRNI